MAEKKEQGMKYLAVIALAIAALAFYGANNAASADGAPGESCWGYATQIAAQDPDFNLGEHSSTATDPGEPRVGLPNLFPGTNGRMQALGEFVLDGLYGEDDYCDPS